MRLPRFHIALKILFVFTLMFYSAGFTTVVEFCSMSQTSECCCGANHRSHSRGNQDGADLIPEIPSCYAVKVVGGLNDTKATITADYRMMNTAEFVAVVDSELLWSQKSISHRTHASLYPPAPTGDDVYLLNGSLLI